MTDNNAHTNYSFADIERYLSGGMTAKEMHAMERAALQDPFLADAIDGYRVTDTNLASQHLNEIAAALQKEQLAKVIVMPKKRNYAWLIAASLLAVIGTGVFLFTGQNKTLSPLADNTLKSIRPTDSITEDSKSAAPQSDSQPATSTELTLTKPQADDRDRVSTLQKKKSLPAKESAVTPAPQQEAADVATTYNSPLRSDKAYTEDQPVQALPDSAAGVSAAQANVSGYESRKARLANTWTTDKGKPFLLSDVEVVSIGKKERKRADTTSVKPEGGWQSFQDYLFSRLSRHDSLSFVNNSTIAGNLELEFSIDESGSPYDVKVLHAQDSTITNKIVDALQSGPKWTSRDKKDKRLRLRY